MRPTKIIQIAIQFCGQIFYFCNFQIVNMFLMIISFNVILMFTIVIVLNLCIYNHTFGQCPGISDTVQVVVGKVPLGPKDTTSHKMMSRLTWANVYCCSVDGKGDGSAGFNRWVLAPSPLPGSSSSHHSSTGTTWAGFIYRSNTYQCLFTIAAVQETAQCRRLNKYGCGWKRLFAQDAL